MTDTEKIIIRGFATGLEKDAALPRFALKGIVKAKNALKSTKNLASKAKSGLKGEKVKVTKGNPLTKSESNAYATGKKLYDNKKGIAIGGGSALGGAGLNEVFSGE